MLQLLLFSKDLMRALLGCMLLQIHRPHFSVITIFPMRVQLVGNQTKLVCRKSKTRMQVSRKLQT